MNIYKLIIRYNGARYKGWQVQNGDFKTVQGELVKALEKLTKGKMVKVLGSGRTDTGVHALGQVVRIEIDLDLEAEKLIKAINSNIPDDIEVIELEKVTDNFHPVRDAIKKEYRYYFTTGKSKQPFLKDFLAQFPFEIDENLMKECCKLIIGEQDFQNFFCTGTEINSTIRTIFECELKKFKGEGPLMHMVDEYYEFRIVGSGFLKQMVRLIVGGFCAVASGRKTLDELKESLKVASEHKLGPTAPASGLYLHSVTY